MLNTGDKLVRFNLDELAYVEADRTYCTLFMADGMTHYQVGHPLAYMEGILRGDWFIRISRSYIVNIWHVCRKMGNMLYVDGRKQPLLATDSYRHNLDGCFLVIGLTGQK